jgi:hypothetical protein
MVKLAGFTGKRTFSVIRIASGRLDFCPCLITNSLEKIEADISKRRATNTDTATDWLPFILLDNGDWSPVTDEIRTYCK